MDAAYGLGYHDGGGVLQIIKRLEKKAQGIQNGPQKMDAYQKELSSVER